MNHSFIRTRISGCKIPPGSLISTSVVALIIVGMAADHAGFSLLALVEREQGNILVT